MRKSAGKVGDMIIGIGEFVAKVEKLILDVTKMQV
jgi:hypothetical protein